VPIFRRKPQAAASAPVAAPQAAAPTPGPVTSPLATDAEAATPANLVAGGAIAQEGTLHGPFDAGVEPEGIGPQVDLGSLKIPAVAGMQVRLEIDRASQLVTGVTLILAQPSGISNMQLQAFAAPKTDGIWDEIREEIGESIRTSGGSVDDVPGVFGRELIARIPGQLPNGAATTQAVRFLGVDGPRWFLRGVVTGPAALDDKAAKILEEVFRRTVVVRGDTPRPPRDLLALTLPGQIAAAAAEAQAAADAKARPTLNPFERGPEITEIH
jgi:hypothetical protein